jgi:hypothetical protein
MIPALASFSIPQCVFREREQLRQGSGLKGRPSRYGDNDDSRFHHQGPGYTLLFLDIAPRAAAAMGSISS